MDDPDRNWDLHYRQLREKSSLGFDHNWLMTKLDHLLLSQLDWREYQVRANAGHVHRPEAAYYIPNVFVLPVAFGEPFRGRPGTLEVYRDPVPLVVEIRSPSTGGYDVDDKLPEYMARGDREIWRLHPLARTLTAWRPQSDGNYREAVHRGTAELAALPGAGIDLDALFAEQGLLAFGCQPSAVKARPSALGSLPQPYSRATSAR